LSIDRRKTGPLRPVFFFLNIVLMAGLVAAIHVFFLTGKKDVHARHKAGHDEFRRQ
jgi:hypothetical protein